MKTPPRQRKVSLKSQSEWASALRQAGLKRTAARIAVLEHLDAADAPVTHKDLVERLTHLGYERATIYRILMDLVGAGLVTRQDLGHWWRFELRRDKSQGHRSEHPHFLCNECGLVVCLPDSAVRLVPARGAPHAISRRGVEVQLKGRCDTCSARRPATRADATGAC